MAGKSYTKIISFIVFLAVVIGLCVLAVPLVDLLRTEEGRQKIKELTDEHFVLGIIVYLVLQALQVVVALIPGGVIQILGGILFGNVLGLIFSLTGIFLGECVVFYFVRKFGSPIVDAFVSKKELKHLSIFENAKRFEMLVFVLFLIPGMPKDVFTYLVPLSKIKAKTFLIYSMIARAPAVTMSIFMGSSVGKGNFIAAIIIFSAALVVGMIGILFKDKILEIYRNKKM